jgi:hypothetical protein
VTIVLDALAKTEPETGAQVKFAIPDPSETSGLEYTTLVPFVVPAGVTLMFAGHVIRGGWVSVIVTLKEHVEDAPPVLYAVQNICSWSNKGSCVPLGIEQTTD